MKLKNYKIIDFATTRVNTTYIVTPKGSTFYGAIVLHDGIYGWWAVPELDNPDDLSPAERHSFTVIKNDESIPLDATFVAVLSNIIEMDDGNQGVMVYPLYKFNEIL